MSASSRGKGDFLTKEERDQHQDQLSWAPSSSRRWSACRNPRIVRVPRTCGGKDRHSKVCTVRGLRDRRIRLSVPTALQLYDLQDKLGVSQPSMVIDWLIDVTKQEIDKLPPLQMPPGFSGGFPLVSPIAPFFDIGSSASAFLKHGFIDPMLPSKNVISIYENPGRGDSVSRSKHWGFNDLAKAKGKEVEIRESHHDKARVVDPNVPAPHKLGSRYGFMSHGDQNHFTDSYTDSMVSSLSLSSNIHHNPSYYYSPCVPHLFPAPYNNAMPHTLVAENSFQLFGSGQSFMQPLHLFGSSTSRPVLAEYVKLLPQEHKTGNPPSTW